MPEDFQAPTVHVDGMRTTRDCSPEESLRRAGWSRRRRVKVGHGPFEALRWSNIRTLIAARDEVILKNLAPDADIAGKLRAAWLDERLASGEMRADAVARPIAGLVPKDASSFRVLLVGDTGDGSQAQAAVAVQLEGRLARDGAQFGTEKTAAILIESDIIYPAGSAGEYGRKFFRPYEHRLLARRVPIFAVPGNHDWNDGSLTGFMRVFCGVQGGLPAAVKSVRARALGGPRARMLWHDAYRFKQPGVPSGPALKPGQPGPYVALDVGGVLFLGIDTGYDGTIDHAQAEWLVNMVDTHPEVPKILFSGSPLIVNGQRKPCAFQADADGNCDVHGDGGARYLNVDDVVRRQANGFVAAIGGDVHNYQRYVARIAPLADPEAERILPYIVCGGGGVFIGQTWWLPRVSMTKERPEDASETVSLDEAETVLFPTRGHSRMHFDAVRRHAVASISSFTLPLGLAVAGALIVVLQPWGDVVAGAAGCGLALLVNKWRPALIVGAAAAFGAVLTHELHPATPSFALGFALIAAAVALNMSAPPIAPSGFIASTSSIAGAVLLVACAVTVRPLDVRGDGLGTGWAAILLGAALFLLVARDVRQLRPVAGVLSLVGFLATLATVLVLIDHAFPSSSRLWFEGVGAGLTIATLLVLTNPTTALRRVDESFARIAKRLQHPLAEPATSLISWIPAWVAKRQKTATIYETFSDGRLRSHAARGLGKPGRRPYLPLYRSLLEIEFRRTGAPAEPAWEFAFTAVGVTGEANRETDPDVDLDPLRVDSFLVHWTPATLVLDGGASS